MTFPDIWYKTSLVTQFWVFPVDSFTFLVTFWKYFRNNFILLKLICGNHFEICPWITVAVSKMFMLNHNGNLCLNYILIILLYFCNILSKYFLRYLHGDKELSKSQCKLNFFSFFNIYVFFKNANSVAWGVWLAKKHWEINSIKLN